MAGEIVRIGFFFQLRLFLSFIAGLWDDKKTKSGGKRHS